MRTRKDKVKWILKFLDLCVLWTCAVSYWEEVRRSLCRSARMARGDAWMMLSFLIFLPSSGPGLGEPNRGQDPRCPGEAHHGVNIHSSTRRGAAWLGWKRSSSGSKGHAVQAQSSSGLGLWKTAVLCCKLLGKNRRNSITQRMPNWILSNRKE